MDYEAAYRQFYEEPHRHEAKLSHEALSGAAAFWAVREWEKRQEAQGYHPQHKFTKEALGTLAGVAVDRLIETKGMDYIDAHRAKHQAKLEAENIFNRRYGIPGEQPGYQPPAQYGPSSGYGPGSDYGQATPGFGQQQYGGGGGPGQYPSGPGYSQQYPQQERYPTQPQPYGPQQSASSPQGQYPSPTQAAGAPYGAGPGGQYPQQNPGQYPSGQTYPQAFQRNEGPRYG